MRINQVSKTGLCAGLFAGAMLFATQSLAAATTELTTDRPGSDYVGFDLASPDPALCRKACDDDAKCKAYTYVKPGVQGPSARCYLKDPAPAAQANDCCVSGVKTAQPALRAAPPQPGQSPARRTTKPADSPASAQTRSDQPLVAKPAITAIAAKPVDPGPLGKGQAEGSLNGVDVSKLPQCSASGIGAKMFALLNQIAGYFGASASVGSHCGAFKREVTAGVTTLPAPAANPKWDYLGGRGDLMADAALCLIKDIGAAPGGRVTRLADTDVAGVADISLKQTVGLSKFDAAARTATLYNQIEICAPIIGCLDAQRQDITATVRKSAPAWPGGMRAGDFPIGDSYSIELSTSWADSHFGATLPPFTILTPYGSATIQPKFDYSSSLYPVDTPFSKQGAARLAFNHPAGRGASDARIQDLYGRSGAPFVINLISHLPETYSEPPDDWPDGVIFIPKKLSPDKAEGWSSQLLFGSRNGVGSKKPWTPSASDIWPSRPDLDLDAPRSLLERAPSANFVAQTPVTIKPPGAEIAKILPTGLASVKKFELVLTPRFAADYAAQVGLMEREAKFLRCKLSGEFEQPCGLAEALLYTQTRAEGRADIVVDLNIKLVVGVSPFDFTFDCCDPKSIPLGSPDIDKDPKPPGADPYANLARASVLAGSPVKDIASVVKGLSGYSSKDLRKWRDQCLATQAVALTTPPEPKHDPGDPQDLLPKLLPCNICVADDPAHNPPFYIPKDKVSDAFPASKKWTCEWKGNSGCHDMCAYQKTADGKSAIFTKAVISAVDIDGDRCKSPKPFVPR